MPETSRRSMLLTRFLGWAAGVFFHVQRKGEPVPHGPLLVVANHPNSLMDPLVLFRVLDRPTRPLARAPLFEQRVLGAILRTMGGLPVYRREDLPDQMHLNRGTFDAAVKALHAGEAVQLYPEGLSHSGASMAPLRTGAARIAFQAEEEMGWGLGLRILPVGLTYLRKTFFRGEVVASIGRPIPVAEFRTVYEEDTRQAVRRLTDRIRGGLEIVTLNLDSPTERELVSVAERIYARELGLAKWREREALGDRLPRLQLFARGAAWLRTEDPETYRRLSRRIRAYERAAGILGAGTAEVPPAFQWTATFRYGLVEGGLLILEAPFAALGILAWLPVYLGTRPIVARMNPAYEAVSTFKFSASVALALLTYTAWVLLAWWMGGWSWALGTGLILVPLGLISIAWHERWTRVEEDVRLFLKLLFRKDRRERLARMRQELLKEFDAIVRDIEAGDDEEGNRADPEGPRAADPEGPLAGAG